MVKRKNVYDDAPHQSDSAVSGSAESTEGPEDVADEDGLIKKTNALSPDDFKAQHMPADMLTYRFKAGSIEQTVTLDFKASADLSKAELLSCFALIETTSRADYEPSSFGWHPKRKLREMKEAEMKYLLVRDPSNDSVAGFLSFMVTHDSTPSMPVLYIYEIHLEQNLRKSGLGSHLMANAESIAVNVGVEKVMLTCFLSNEKALGFYRRRGYRKDVCSPEDRRTRRKVVKMDYVILSKAIRDRQTEGKMVGLG